ncbi:hypothetical protein CTI14_67315, partial [Methylobacterium radiotolerans]
MPLCALLWPIKKIAAGFAMVGVTAYCAFSGWDIAAERSLIMTLIMLGAPRCRSARSSGRSRRSRPASPWSASPPTAPSRA